MVTHLPFRTWCPHCVRGQSHGKQHARADASVKSMPTVSVDYMYMHESQERHEEKGMPTLVARDVNQGSVGTGMLFARLVPTKGVNPYAVKSLAKDIAALGYTELVLKSDGEPAISALKQAVRMERHERIVIESSPVKESKSNGAAENAVQQVQVSFVL